MSDALIKVRLSGPAKVGARWFKQGEESVTADQLKALEDAGLLLPADPEAEVSVVAAAGGEFPDLPEATPVVFDQDSFAAAVAAEARKLAGQAFDGELGKMESEVKDLVALAEKEKAEFLSRLDETANLLSAERQKTADLVTKLTAAEAEVATLRSVQTENQAKTNTPPSENVAKTAQKKGAATPTKG